jgi:prepilin-type processing-associated H-X9-DG protein
VGFRFGKSINITEFIVSQRYFVCNRSAIEKRHRFSMALLLGFREGTEALPYEWGGGFGRAQRPSPTVGVLCVILGLGLVAEDVFNGSGNSTDVRTEISADTGSSNKALSGILNMKSLQSATKVPVFAEAYRGSAGEEGVYPFYSKNGDCLLNFLHNGNMNVLWADGHVNANSPEGYKATFASGFFPIAEVWVNGVKKSL